MDEPTRILIIDDQPINIQALTAILEHDYETAFATSGERALEMACTQQPDLILLDIVMPEMDGYAICQQLKENTQTQDIPIIFITGRSAEKDEERGLRMGAVDYIHKPISPPVVKARVDNHVLLKRYRDRLEALSMEDPLTGIGNRRRFEETLAYDWRRSKRTGKPLSLISLDVDHFKAYNDHEGHPAGDACLKILASVLENCVRRPADLACRIGGEEFACVLPETEAGGAEQVAENIRREIEALALPHPESDVSEVVTVSLGFATAIPAEGGDMHALIEAADRSLYSAKESGRNNVGPPYPCE